MSFYDQVQQELGLQFIDVKCRIPLLPKYRKILLSQYPDKAEMGWLTYLICESPEGEFQILRGKGGHPKGEFRSRLQAVLNSATASQN